MSVAIEGMSFSFALKLGFRQVLGIVDEIGRSQPSGTILKKVLCYYELLRFSLWPEKRFRSPICLGSKIIFFFNGVFYEVLKSCRIGF